MVNRTQRGFEDKNNIDIEFIVDPDIKLLQHNERVPEQRAHIKKEEAQRAKFLGVNKPVAIHPALLPIVHPLQLPKLLGVPNLQPHQRLAVLPQIPKNVRIGQECSNAICLALVGGLVHEEEQSQGNHEGRKDQEGVQLRHGGYCRCLWALFRQG
jgi:hypothetical protein